MSLIITVCTSEGIVLASDSRSTYTRTENNGATKTIKYGIHFVDEYKPIGADGAPVLTFLVGNLTWEGYDFLEKIRQDTVWNKTKDVITQKGLPMILDVVKDVSATVIASMTEGAIKALKN